MDKCQDFVNQSFEALDLDGKVFEFCTRIPQLVAKETHAALEVLGIEPILPLAFVVLSIVLKMKLTIARLPLSLLSSSISMNFHIQIHPGIGDFQNTILASGLAHGCSKANPRSVAGPSWTGWSSLFHDLLRGKQQPF